MRHWGFDPGVIRSLSQPPRQIGGPTEWFSDEDYPEEAVRSRQQGSVLTRLIVGIDGRVADCIILDSSGYPALDRRTCEVLITRGRYQPALAASGEPVRGLASIRFYWSMP